jgi:hypothetical protein
MEYNEGFNIPLPFHNERFLKLEFAQLKKESSTKPNPQRETSDLKAEAMGKCSMEMLYLQFDSRHIPKSQRRDYYIDKH